MEEIFRVESKRTGNGWYNHGHGHTPGWYDEAHDLWDEICYNESLDEHPNPVQDGITDFGDHHFFGFLTMEELEGWFGEKTLDVITGTVLKEWFEIVRYEASPDDVLYGKSQVAFVRHLATNRTVLAR